MKFANDKFSTLAPVCWKLVWAELPTMQSKNIVDDLTPAHATKFKSDIRPLPQKQQQTVPHFYSYLYLTILYPIAIARFAHIERLSCVAADCFADFEWQTDDEFHIR